MRPPRRMAGPRTAAAGTSGLPDSGGVAHGPGRRPLDGAGSCMRPREGGAPTACAAKPKAVQRHEGPGRSWNRPGPSLFPSKPFAAALGVFRPHAGKLGLAWFSRVGMAGLEPAASRPPAARAANCATFRNRRHPLSEPKPRWAKKEDGGVARRPGLEPGSTVLETAVLAIAPPTQREASMTPRAWPPGPPEGRRRGRLSRAPSRIRTGDLPLTRRLRYHWAIGALTVPPIAFSNA